MREIEFRAKAINRDPKQKYRTNYKNGDWVYGLITDLPFKTSYGTLPAHMTNKNGVSGIDVDFETLGQYTGLNAKNGKKIFEGDIIKYTNNQRGVYEIGKKLRGCILFDEDNQCYISKNNFQKDMDWQYAEDIKIIGNIYDNLELLGYSNQELFGE